MRNPGGMVVKIAFMKTHKKTYFVINPKLFGGDDSHKKFYKTLGEFREIFPEKDRHKITRTSLMFMADYIIEEGSVMKDRGLNATLVCIDPINEPVNKSRYDEKSDDKVVWDLDAPKAWGMNLEKW